MSSKIEKNILVKKIFAWSGLLLIAALIVILVYALIFGNGMMALAAIVSIFILSIVYWIGICAYKRLTTMKDLEEQVKEKEKINELSKINTKNI